MSHFSDFSLDTTFPCARERTFLCALVFIISHFALEEEA